MQKVLRLPPRVVIQHEVEIRAMLYLPFLCAKQLKTQSRLTYLTIFVEL